MTIGTHMTQDTGNRKRSARRRLMTAAIVLGASLATTSCGSTAGSAAALAPAAAADRTSSTIVGGGTGGAGSITVAISEPVAISGHVDTEVTCLTTKRSYQARAATAEIQGYQVSFSVVVAPYSGPGTYPAIVTVSVTQPDGSIISVPAQPGIPAELTSVGGGFSVSATSADGRTVAASLSWGCSQ